MLSGTVFSFSSPSETFKSDFTYASLIRLFLKLLRLNFLRKPLENISIHHINTFWSAYTATLFPYQGMKAGGFHSKCFLNRSPECPFPTYSSHAPNSLDLSKFHLSQTPEYQSVTPDSLSRCNRMCLCFILWGCSLGSLPGYPAYWWRAVTVHRDFMHASPWRMLRPRGSVPSRSMMSHSAPTWGCRAESVPNPVNWVSEVAVAGLKKYSHFLTQPVWKKWLHGVITADFMSW